MVFSCLENLKRHMRIMGVPVVHIASPNFGTRSEEKKVFEQSDVQVFRASNLNVNIVVNDETASYQDRLNVTTSTTQAVDVDSKISWNRTKAEIEDYQLKDPSIGLFLKQLEQLGFRFEPGYNDLGANQIKREEALKYGPEFVGNWSQWEQLAISNGVLYRKWKPNDRHPEYWQVVVPKALRRELLQHLHCSEVSGGHFAVEKTLLRIKQRFWWPTVRSDVERTIRACGPCAAKATGGKQRKANLRSFVVTSRFSVIAADILGPVTTGGSSKAKHILVMTDMFTKYVVTTPLINTVSQTVAQQSWTHGSCVSGYQIPCTPTKVPTSTAY